MAATITSIIVLAIPTAMAVLAYYVIIVGEREEMEARKQRKQRRARAVH